MNRIDISSVDLNWLVRGKSYTIPCSLFCNGYQVSTFALANTRANIFTLISSKCTPKISKFLNTPFEKLSRLVLVYGYNSLIGKPITTIL